MMIIWRSKMTPEVCVGMHLACIVHTLNCALFLPRARDTRFDRLLKLKA